MQEVNQLLRQYAQMRKMFKSAGKGGGMQRRMMGALGGMRGMGARSSWSLRSAQN